jgi:hypothetical protein
MQYRIRNGQRIHFEVRSNDGDGGDCGHRHKIWDTAQAEMEILAQRAFDDYGFVVMEVWTDLETGGRIDRVVSA